MKSECCGNTTVIGCNDDGKWFRAVGSFVKDALDRKRKRDELEAQQTEAHEPADAAKETTEGADGVTAMAVAVREPEPKDASAALDFLEGKRVGVDMRV